jgi:radical SAM-linked protein
MGRTRYRLRFTKRDALRFISHHDMMKVFELALRRSGLPVSYTQGFNPRPRVSFALALPLGVESLDEIVDIDLEHESDPPAPDTVLETLAKQMPGGLNLLDAAVATGRPQVVAIEYRCEIPPDMVPPDQLQQRLEQFLASGSHPFTRSRGDKKAARSFDARAFTLDARLEDSVLHMRLKSGQEGGMKPSDLLQVLGLDPNRLPVTKTRSILNETLPDNAPAPPGDDEN